MNCVNLQSSEPIIKDCHRNLNPLLGHSAVGRGDLKLESFSLKIMEGMNTPVLDIPRRSLQADFAEDQLHVKRDTSADYYKTICWGCGILVECQVIHPVFMCSWCGAISNRNVQVKKQGRCSNCYHILDRVLIAIIISMEILVIGGGVWAVFPILCPEIGFTFFFHAMVTGLLSFNTLFNYCVAAFMQAGPLPEIAWGSIGSINEGSLHGYRFCDTCHKPKPPRAHHCRACNACVNEMDHHCPFIGNCVGSANLRPFVLFLLFAVLSNVYVFLMAISTIGKIWKTQVNTLAMLGLASNSKLEASFSMYVQALLGSSITSSVRALGLLYLVAISLSVTIGVGLLLHHHVKQLYDGDTFIEVLQREKGVIKGLPQGEWRNLQRVFGHGNPFFWILPRLCIGSNGKVHDK